MADAGKMKLLDRKRKMDLEKAGRETKQRRMLYVKKSKSEVESMIFQAFEKQSHYTLKQLQDFTQQPKDYLTGFLRDMCEYHKNGEHIHTYSLKPIYGR